MIGNPQGCPTTEGGIPVKLDESTGATEPEIKIRTKPKPFILVFTDTEILKNELLRCEEMYDICFAKNPELVKRTLDSVKKQEPDKPIAFAIVDVGTQCTNEHKDLATWLKENCQGKTLRVATGALREAGNLEAFNRKSCDVVKEDSEVCEYLTLFYSIHYKNTGNTN